MALSSSESGNVVAALAADVKLPRMAKVRQIFDAEHIEAADIPGVMRGEMSRPAFAERVKPGDSVAISCGSRGVANIALITREIVDFVKRRGGIPFVFPAMGSHGGATAQGQLQILADYGVTESYLGCEIRASMDTQRIGTSTDGVPVYADSHALAADAIILCGRIKAHTAFHGPYESGLFKMAVIGMGKQRGAEAVHAYGFGPMGRLLPNIAKVSLKNTKIIGGIGIIENAFDQTCKLRALTSDEIAREEPALLEESKRRMGRIHLDNIDVLVVDRMGKDISGDGMDPNITGRYTVNTVRGDRSVQRIAVLDLTDGSHGNCIGIGVADVTTRRLVDKIDVDATYPNVVTNTVLSAARIPVFTHTDRQCVQIALRSCNDIDREHPRIVRIRDTMHLDTIWVSEALLNEAAQHPSLETLTAPEHWPFDDKGNLWP